MYAGRIYADFQNLDDEGRIRLDTVGSRRDLVATETELRAGAVVRLYTDDADDDGNPDPLLVEGTLTPEADQGFVAAVNWATVRSASQELELLKKRFFDTAVGDVLRALDGSALIGATTLGLCVLDHLGYLRTKNGNREDFEQIVKDCLSARGGRYDAEWLWEVRNGLAHVHGVSRKLQRPATQLAQVVFTHLHPELHLRHDGSVRVLNVESFVADVIAACWTAFNDFRKSPEKPLAAFLHLLIVGQSDADADKEYGRMHHWLARLDREPFQRSELEEDIRKGLEKKNAERKSA